MLSLLAVLVILGYYLAAWLKVGRDPAEETIIPHFTQPRGVSPASVRYVMQMGYDRKALAHLPQLAFRFDGSGRNISG
jgi:hypothetical protein